MSKRRLVYLSLLVFCLGFFSLPNLGRADFTPYFGQTYKQPEQVLNLFPDPKVSFDTPGFAPGKSNFTSQEEMIAFIKKLERKNPYMSVKIIGRSLEGREIPLILFSKGKNLKKKPTVWLQGQIHGNEPAGGESTLVMAEKLAHQKLGKDLLNHINVIIVPRVNPDGSYKFVRYMANGMDGNRDQMKFELPEVQAIQQAKAKYDPEVVIDVHEYTVKSSAFSGIGKEGGLSSYDLLVLSAKNLNIPKYVRTTADSLLNKVKKDLRNDHFSVEDYYTVEKKGDQLEVTEGSTEPRIGRNSMGLNPSISYLVETRGIGIGRESFARRVASQVATHTDILTYVANHANQVKAVVDKARADIVQKGKTVNDDDPIVVTSENTPLENQTLDVVDIAKGEKTKVKVEYFSATNARPVLERERPTAYIIPPAYHQIAEKLKIYGVKVQKLRKDTEVPVEAFTVTDKTVDTEYYEGHYLTSVKTNVTTKNVLFPKGSYVFSMAQPEANMISLALEPESVDSYVTFNYLPVDIGDEIPVYRYMQADKLKVK